MTARRATYTLTPFATDYLKSQPAARDVVRQFDLWLKASFRSIRQLSAAEIEPFLYKLSKTPEKTRGARQRHQALKYFDWLHAQDLLQFDPRCAWPRSNFPLPPHAQRFLDLLKPTHKLQTVRGHQTSLRQFHIWLNANHCSLTDIDRSRIESWLSWLHARGLAACSRVNTIQHVRAYLDWLEEQGVLATSSALIRSSDLPRLPQYLPRPVSPNLDTELQRRFKSSGCTYQLGMLLMRRTGLRIGELIALPYQCVSTDPAGNTLLKVPLGKLATERLVPLDPFTAKLFARLQRNGSRKRSLLLVTASGRKTDYVRYREALKKACSGLSFQEPMTTHRLRHTYATQLLSAGMNLPSVMRLLGHTDYRMTLRYAAITDSTVFTEFDSALQHNAQRYPTVAAAAATASTTEPARALPDLVRYVQKCAHEKQLDYRTAFLLVRRIRRLQADLRKISRKSPPKSAD
jgi:site-specific recombinase XerD